MAGGRRINVTVEADTDGSFDKAARGLDDVAKSGDKADASLRKLTKGHQVLDAEINKVGHSVKALRDKFAETGDTGLLGDIDKQSRTLKKLKTQLTQFVGDAGKDGGEIFTSGFLKTFQSLPPQAKVAIVAGVAAAAPVLGGVLSAAVAAGIGGAGLAAGIALAARNPQVQQSFQAFGKVASAGLTDASKVFVAPLVSAAGDFQTAFDKVLPRIRSNFAALSSTVAPLTKGLIGFVDKALPGIDTAVAAALPVLRQLGAELPGIGRAFSNMLTNITGDSQGAVAGIKLLGTTLRATFETLGLTIGNASRALGTFDALIHGEFLSALSQTASVGGSFPKWLNETVRAMGPVGQITAGFIDNLGRLNQAFDATRARTPVGAAVQATMAAAAAATAEAKAKADALAQSWQRLFNLQSGNLGTTLQFNQGLHELATSVREGGRALDDHSLAGIRNNQVILGEIQTIAQWRQRNQEAGASAYVLEQGVESMREKLVQHARDVGLDGDQVDQLTRSYLGVPTQVDTKVNADTGKADADVHEHSRLLDSVDGRVATSTIVTNIVTNRIERFTRIGSSGSVGNQAFASLQRWGGAYEHAAAGLLREASIYSARNPGRYMIAEPGTRGEAFIPKSGDRDRSMGILNKAASWYGASVVPRSGYGSPVSPGGGAGGGTVVLKLEAGGMGSRLEQALLEFLAKSIRTDRATTAAVRAAAA